MGLLKLIGTVAGGAIGFAVGGPGGAITGAKIGGAVGGAASGGNSSTGTQQIQYIQSPKTTSLEDIRTGGSKAMDILSKRQQETKVAKSANIPKIADNGLLEDPWKPSRDWWEDLGGEPDRYGPIDDTRFA